MFRLLKRENLKFIVFLAVGSSLAISFSFIVIGKTLIHSYNQYEYVNKSMYNYVYETSQLMNINSYQEFHSKQFYLDEQLTNRLQVNPLMKQNVEYDEYAFIRDENFLKGRMVRDNRYEVVITLDTSVNYNLNVYDVIYSVNKYDQKTYSYQIVGIFDNVYNWDTYSYAQNKGVILFSYNHEESTNFLTNFINFSKSDPSENLINSDSKLINLYYTETLIRKPLLSTLSLLAIYVVLLFSIFGFSYQMILKNSSSYLHKLSLLGASNIYDSMLICKAVLYFISSFFATIIFFVIFPLLIDTHIPNIFLVFTLLNILLVVCVLTLIKRFIRFRRL